MPEHWEEAWLEHTKGWPGIACQCGNWQDPLWVLLPDGDARLAPPVDDIERGEGEGEVVMGGTDRVTIGEDGW
uniref:ORF2 n=1 Tax=Torque teno sus virus 1a TaxID=687386 RepID=F8TX53_9VIRU|nr:ORF2 [Torque teno sus virus 1a]AEB34227.1 ORF2 [Torque teno sus virus 1a]